MKLRISFFDRTICKKDTTRFWPVWVLYTICLLMGMLLMRQDNKPYRFLADLAMLPQMMAVINLCYALVVAQVLFSDLYQSRLCNAIHALPVRREGLFFSHVATGVAWSVVPTALATLLALWLQVGSSVENGWQIPLWWLLSSNLQYLFFFGVAVFSALCVGNRFAQAVVYGLLNFGSVLLYCLVDMLYTPLLYGLRTAEHGFMLASPVVNMAQVNYLKIEKVCEQQYTYCLNEGWGYLAVCAVIGVVLTGIACLLYRKRDLECAGDFMAFRGMEPVFQTVYSLTLATMVYFFVDKILYVDGVGIVYLAIGLIIGFFSGEMLLKRTIRVFHKKAFLKLAVLAGAFALSLGVTALDLLGLVSWIPDAKNVESAQIWNGYYSSFRGSADLTTPEEIQDVQMIHEQALEEEKNGYGQVDDKAVEVCVSPIAIHYTLKDGTTRTRYYDINAWGPAGEKIRSYFSTMDALFYDYVENTSPEAIAKQTIRIEGHYGEELQISDPTQILELVQAIEADCVDGNMAQSESYHEEGYAGYLYLSVLDSVDTSDNVRAISAIYVELYGDCHHVLSWLEEHPDIMTNLD